MSTETAPAPVDIAALITDVLRVARTPAEQAEAIIKAVDAAGGAVLAPQDLAWGVCPGPYGEEADQPHYVSLSLCSGCLEYDPE